MAAGGHFGCPKLTFDGISGYFRSIQNSFFLNFFTKWPSAPAHFGCPKFTFDRISGHFRSIRNVILFDFFYKMAAGGHLGCPKITFDHISLHFRFFWKSFTKWPPALILDFRNSLLIAFLAISDRYATFFFNF